MIRNTNTGRTGRSMRFVIAACGIASPLLASPAANAANPASPYGFVWVDSWTGNVASVCAIGNVDDGTNIAGEWVFSATVSRADGTSQTTPPVQHAGATFPKTCRSVTAQTATGTTGAIAGHLEFAGAGTGDVAGHAGLLVHFTPLTPRGETSWGTSR